jgi:hypothetical protein
MAQKKFDHVYQFKITLNEIKPPIWRRIQVPENYTFWDLHVAIQDAMGWLDYHLHQFEIVNPSYGMKESIGIPDEEFGDEVLPGWEQKIAKYFSPANKIAYYIYDFGDNWEHTVQLEKILPCEKNVRYPVCVEGNRACPPEDCGGIWGYHDFLEIIMDPGNEQYEEILEWVGGEFEPEAFNPAEVIFTDPVKRKKLAFS